MGIGRILAAMAETVGESLTKRVPSPIKPSFRHRPGATATFREPSLYRSRNSWVPAFAGITVIQQIPGSKTFKTFAAGLGLLVITNLAACSSAAPETITIPVPEPTQTPASTAKPADGGGIKPILATTVLNPGEQRVAFLLVGERAIIKAPEATVTATYLGEGQTQDVRQQVQATYHEWPYGIRGAYSSKMSFDRPGHWQLMVSVASEEVTGSAVIDLDVAEEAPVPAIGERPPLSRTKTLAEVGSIEKLTTDYNADEELYRISVADAIESPRPAVVVFASPAFCTSPICGPQVDTVKELKAIYQDRADFVHVEIYDLPDEIQGDLSRAQPVAAVAEWGFSALPHWLNESWVFIINDKGTIDQRFEGYATLTELEAALKETLEEGLKIEKGSSPAQ